MFNESQPLGKKEAIEQRSRVSISLVGSATSLEEATSDTSLTYL
jgi:hypothetical protein